MDFSDFTIVVPSLLIGSVKHIDAYATSLNISAFISVPYELQGPFEFSENISYSFPHPVSSSPASFRCQSCKKSLYIGNG